MFKHRITDEVDTIVYVDWFLLSVLAGAINTGGYIACHRFVTHVTGFATLAGIEAASAKWLDAFGMLTVPAFFLAGVMISAYLIDRPMQDGKRPHYTTVMSLVLFCIVIAGLGGVLGWYGEFGAAAIIEQDYLLLASLCLASGLQNAALTTASGASVRTTHLTGITTDLGIGLIRMVTVWKTNSPKRKEEFKGNWLRLGTIGSFALGSGVGAVLFLNFGYYGFLGPAALASYAVYEARRVSRQA